MKVKYSQTAMNALARNLKLAMDAKGLNNKDLAALIDVDPRTISSYVTATHYPPKKRQDALSEALGVKPANLFPHLDPDFDWLFADSPKAAPAIEPVPEPERQPDLYFQTPLEPPRDPLPRLAESLPEGFEATVNLTISRTVPLNTALRIYELLNEAA